MDPKLVQLRNRLLALGFVVALPKAAQAGDAISNLEAQKLVEIIGKRPQGQNDQQADLVELLGVNRELWGRLTKELATAADCAALLAPEAKGGTATRLALGQILAADSKAQELAKKAFLDGISVTEPEIIAVQAAVGHPSNVVLPELGFKEAGFLFTYIDPRVDKDEVYSLFQTQLMDLAKHKELKYPQAKVFMKKISVDEGKVSFTFAIQRPQKEAVEVKIRDWELGENETAPEVVANTMVAAIQYADVLEQPQRLLQEVNMFRYDLLKLYRLADESSKESLSDAIFLLKDAGESGFFESSAAYTGRLFESLLQAKMEVIELSQSVQATIAANGVTELVSSKDLAKAKSAKKRVKRTKKAAALAGAAAKPADVDVAFSPRLSPSQAFYRQAGTQHGYYYPTRYRDEDTQTIATMAWYMDPSFMLTHPWYWGTEDNSMRAPLLMYDLITHNHQEQSTHSGFQGRTPYDPSRFNEPLEPVLYTSEARPYAEAWDATPQSKTERQTAAEMLGWSSVTGPSAGEDFSPTPGVQSTSSSSGWSSSSSSSTFGGIFSTTGSTTTTTTTTTGSLFDFTGSTTTTTGSDWSSTTTTTTTTTGSDWSSTTTTGSDWSSTTTGSDWSSTGSSTTTGGFE